MSFCSLGIGNRYKQTLHIYSPTTKVAHSSTHGLCPQAYLLGSTESRLYVGVHRRRGVHSCPSMHPGRHKLTLRYAAVLLLQHPCCEQRAWCLTPSISSVTPSGALVQCLQLRRWSGYIMLPVLSVHLSAPCMPFRRQRTCPVNTCLT